MSEGGKMRGAYHDWVRARENERNALDELLDRVFDVLDYDPERAMECLRAVANGDERHDP